MAPQLEFHPAIPVPIPERPVTGTSSTGNGVDGQSGTAVGVRGDSATNTGVEGHGATGVSGFGANYGVVGHAGVVSGVSGYSTKGDGVSGDADGSGTGVKGHSKTGRGVWGLSDAFIATVGDSTSGTGVWGHSISGTGVYGESETGAAGHFEGNVEVTGDIRLKNGDCAEEFPLVPGQSLDPGTVVVLGPNGAVTQSRLPYDTKVAGVVSGAGDFRPAIILDRQADGNGRIPIALIGKVYCKVDAQYGAISVGDMLTTSATPGHAMKASDRLKAFGSVIGKALRALDAGQDSIPILVTLK